MRSVRLLHRQTPIDQPQYSRSIDRHGDAGFGPYLGGPISSCFYETHGYGLFRTGFKKAPVDRRYRAGLLPDAGSLRSKRILNHGQTVFFRGDLDARNLLIGIEKADRQLTDSHPVRIVNRPPRSICQSRGIGRTLRGNAARKAEQ